MLINSFGPAHANVLHSPNFPEPDLQQKFTSNNKINELFSYKCPFEHSTNDPMPWTPEEDNILRAAYEDSPAEWNEIAKKLPLRTETYIKLRWRFKFEESYRIDKLWAQDPTEFLKLIQSRMTPDNGIDFIKLSQDYPGKYPFEWRERWKNLNYKLEAYAWSPEDDIRLINAFLHSNGRNWDEIAKEFPGRDWHSCWYRFHILTENAGPTAKVVNYQSDELTKETAAANLEIIFREEEPCNSKNNDFNIDNDIDHIVDLTPDPMLLKKYKKWTEAEDSILYSVYAESPEDWSTIATKLPLKTVDQIKVRWASKFENSYKIDKLWAKDPTEFIKLVLSRCAPECAPDENVFKKLSQDYPGKFPYEWRKRWGFVNPDRIFGFWSKEEDTKLLDSIKLNNGKNWAEIAKSVPGRQLFACRQRYQTLKKKPNLVNDKSGDTDNVQAQ